MDSPKHLQRGNSGSSGAFARSHGQRATFPPDIFENANSRSRLFTQPLEIRETIATVVGKRDDNSIFQAIDFIGIQIRDCFHQYEIAAANYRDKRCHP